MKILVTGATGFVGRALIPLLKDHGHDLCAIVRDSTDVTGLELLGVPVIKDDRERDLLADISRQGPFDGVIHLASLFLASHRSQDIVPLISSNVAFPTRILDASIQSNVRWFINTGSAWQHYENRDYSPVNLYASSKQAFETFAQYYVESTNIRFTTLALCDTYGPHDSRQKLLNLWCRVAHNQVPLEMSEGLQKIDLVYISDVVNAFLLSVNMMEEEPPPGKTMRTFGLTSGSSISLRELASVFEEVTGKKLPIKWGARPIRLREVMEPWRSENVVPGWKPKISLHEGLALMWKSFSADSR